MVSLVEEPTSTEQVEKVKPNAEKSVACQPDSTQEEKTDDVVEKESMPEQTAAELLAEGRRHLFCQEFAPAVEKLAQACLMHDTQHGKMTVECADAYYFYGEALLELARLEPGVLGNALQGVAEEDESTDEEEGETEEAVEGEKNDEQGDNAADTTSEPIVKETETTEVQFEDPDKLTETERMEIHEEVEKAFEENAEEADRILAQKSTSEESPAEAESSSPVVDEVDADAAAEEEETAEDAEPDSNEVAVPAEKDTTKADHTQLDDSNLELAWDMLDLARILYEKREGPEFQLKVALCRLKLGEVSIESDNTPKALEDLNVCLELRKSLLPVNDRGLAEVYYQFGLAHTIANDYKLAGEAFTQAKSVLEARKIQLAADVDTVLEDAEKVKITRELAELDALIPDIQLKINDCAESAANAGRDREALANAIDPASTDQQHNGIVVGASEQKANDISGLVRKPVKRKSHEADSTGDATVVEQPEAKRVKSSNGEGTNGCHVVTAEGVAPQ